MTYADISAAFVQAYNENIQFVSQQMGSKLNKTVTVDAGIRGEYKFYDKLESTGYSTDQSRNADTAIASDGFERRRVGLGVIRRASLIDKIDELRMLTDPTSKIAQNIGFAIGRGLDDKVVSGLFATAYTDSGLDGTTPTTIAFPSGNIVAVNERTYQDIGNTKTGNSGLTVAKILKSRELMLAANVDFDNDKVWLAADALSLTTMLVEERVVSKWYNDIQPLVTGAVDSWSGINFVRTQLVVTDGNGNSLLNGSGFAMIPMYTQSSSVLAIAENPTARITERPDKNYSMQAFYECFAGSARIHDNRVMQILADPAYTL